MLSSQTYSQRWTLKCNQQLIEISRYTTNIVRSPVREGQRPQRRAIESPTSRRSSHHLGTAGVTRDNWPQKIGQSPGYMPNSEGLQRRKNAQRTNDVRRDIRTRHDSLLRHFNRNSQTLGTSGVEKGSLQPHAQPHTHGPQGNSKTRRETVRLARNVQTTHKVGTGVPWVPTIQNSTSHRTRSAGLWGTKETLHSSTHGRGRTTPHVQRLQIRTHRHRQDN